jgi:hypothetical protein
MEELLHNIQELQRMADDIARGDVDIARYEQDSETYFERMELFVAVNCYEHADFLGARIHEVKSKMGALMRGNGDIERTHSLVVRGLDGVYRTIKNPPVVRGDEDYSDS